MATINKEKYEKALKKIDTLIKDRDILTNRVIDLGLYSKLGDDLQEIFRLLLKIQDKIENIEIFGEE